MPKNKKLDWKNKKSNSAEIAYYKISNRGKKIIFYSIVSLTLGFVLLKFTNSDGSNWASITSPFIIILSYIGVGIGIVFLEKK